MRSPSAVTDTAYRDPGAILKVFPLDTYVEHPVNLMDVMPGETVETPGPGIPTKKSFVNMMTEETQLLEISSVLHSMMKQKPLTASSPQAKKHCMQTLCCRRVLSSTINSRPSFLYKKPRTLLFGAFFHVMMKTESEINFTEDMI